MLQAKNYSVELPPQEEIIKTYLNVEIELGKSYKSPFRKDNNPSCSFWYSKSGKLYLKDFGTGEAWDAVAIVMKKFDLSYTDALSRIKKEVKVSKKYVPPIIQTKLHFDVVDGEFQYDYWAKYHIPLEVVRQYAGLARSVYRNEDFYARSTSSNPIYYYKFSSGNIKLYRPLADKLKKWGGNSTAEDIGGLTQLPRKGRLCVITSSIKDIMVFKQHGIPAICFNGEGYGLSKESDSYKAVAKIISSLRKRFEHIILALDGDDAGIKFSIKLSSLFSLPYTTIGSTTKDPSDYQMKHGANKSFRKIKKLLSKCLNSNSLQHTQCLPFC